MIGFYLLKKGNYFILGINQNQEKVHVLYIVDDDEPENNDENNTSIKSMKTSGEKTRRTNETLTCVKSPIFNHSETIDVHDIQPFITLNITHNVNDNLPENNIVIHLSDNNNYTNSQPDDNNEISNFHVVNTSIESPKSPEKDSKYKMKSPSNNYEITTSLHDLNTITKSTNSPEVLDLSNTKSPNDTNELFNSHNINLILKHKTYLKKIINTTRNHPTIKQVRNHQIHPKYSFHHEIS